MESIDGAKEGHVSSDESFAITCDPCEYDHISKKAAAYCQECAEYLCESCKTSHGKLKLTRSHKLLSGEFMPPKRSAGKMPVLDTVLCSCFENKVSVHCKEHCALVCVSCKALHHRRCKTSDITDESKDFDVDSTKKTIDNLNDLKETITFLQESREKDLNNLSLEAKECRDGAKQFREELSRKLESMEAKTLSDIKIFKTQVMKTITQHIDTCKAALNSLDTGSRKLQLAKEKNDRQSIFVLNIQLSQAVKSLTTITEEINKEVYQPHISFVCNPSINIAADHDLGMVKRHTFRKPQQKGFDEMSIKASNQVSIKLQPDGKAAQITGSAFLSSGELILCDLNNSKLKLLDIKSLPIKESTLDVPGSPWDVAPVNQHQVIVTFPFEKYLQFIQVKPSFALNHKIDLGIECRGVTVSHEGILVTLPGAGGSKIGMYDLTGKEKCIIGPYDCKDGKIHFNQPWFITVSNDEKIFVVNLTPPTLYCLGSNNTVLYTVSMSAFNLYSGISVDENENVLLCDKHSHKVILITKGGKEVCDFLTEKDGLYQPYTTSFRRSDGTLVVGCGDDNLLVFTLK